MNHELKHSDCIIELETVDINVANIISEEPTISKIYDLSYKLCS